MFYKIHKNKSPFNLLNLYWRKHLYILHLRMLRMLFRWSKLNITFSKTLFYHLQPFVKLKVLTCSIALSSNFIRTTSKNFFNCYNHKRIRLMTRLCIGWAFYVNINSIIILKTALILFVVMVWISSEFLTFFSTVPYLIIKELLS